MQVLTHRGMQSCVGKAGKLKAVEAEDYLEKAALMAYLTSDRAAMEAVSKRGCPTKADPRSSLPTKLFYQVGNAVKQCACMLKNLAEVRNVGI